MGLFLQKDRVTGNQEHGEVRFGGRLFLNLSLCDASLRLDSSNVFLVGDLRGDMRSSASHLSGSVRPEVGGPFVVMSPSSGVRSLTG